MSLDNGAGVPLLFAALAARAKTRTYMDCLQGQGSLRSHPVCRYERPLPTRLGPANVPVLERPERFKGLWRKEDSSSGAAPPPPPPPQSEMLLGASPGAVGLASANDGSLGAVQASTDGSAFG